MDHDILNLVRKRKVTTIINEEYSVLTCRKCGCQEEIIGDVTMYNLSHGWGALSIDSCKVFHWLLCPDCIDKVRKVAGL